MENAGDPLERIISALEHVRTNRPLIHIISNFVTLYDVANATLAIGARPVMAHAIEEVAEIAASAQALVLNLGTPTRERIKAMRAAGRAAHARGRPIVVDPVGVGASGFRHSQTMHVLVEVRPTILRGNADEIAFLGGLRDMMTGVDSYIARYDRPRVVKELALASRRGLVVVATGKVDYASDGVRLAAIHNGHPWLKQVSGTGDVLDALIGAATAVDKDALFAAGAGLVWLGVAAERAAEQAKGLGSFRMALFDALGSLSADVIRKNGRIEITADEGREKADE